MNKKLRRTLHIALASLLMFTNLNVVFATTNKTTLVNDTFEDMEIGKAPVGYEVTDNIYTVSVEDNKVIFADDQAGQLKLNRKFAPINEFLTVSVDFMQQTLGSGTTINLADGTGLRALRLETRNNGTTLNYLVNGTYTKIADITAGKWMNIKLQANVKAQTADIYIDNILKAKAVPFKYEVSEISYFQTLTPHDKVSGHYIDNLVITTQKAPVVIPEDATEIVFTVDQSGKGDFTTVQEAINAIPAKTSLSTTINIKAGTYKEVITVPETVSNLTLIGEDAATTVLTYDNYNAKKKDENSTYGTGGSSSTFIYGSDISVSNLTFENSFEEKGESGEQAVALHVTGNRVQFKDCRFLGNQDTLLLDGKTQYFVDCYIEGDVDFIFGRSQAIFENCEIHSLNRGSKSNNGYVVAPRTSINENYGFVFLNSELTAQEGMAEHSVYLGRPWTPSGMNSDKPSAIFINTEMGSHIKLEPWTSMSGTPASHGRFFEYLSTGAGAVVNENRPQLTEAEASAINYQSVLNGWEPSFAPVLEEVKPEEPVQPEVKPEEDEDDNTGNDSVVKPEVKPEDNRPSLPAISEKIYFSDITVLDAFYDEVMFLAQYGYVNGVDENIFAPQMEMTRAQFATILSRVLAIETTSKESSFKDVANTAWYFESIQACYEKGLIKGISETEFAPNQKLTKQDMLLLLSRALEYLGVESNNVELNYIDKTQISTYAVEGIEACVNGGLIQNEGYLGAKDIVTRAHMATMFTKLIEKTFKS